MCEPVLGRGSQSLVTSLLSPCVKWTVKLARAETEAERENVVQRAEVVTFYGVRSLEEVQATMEWKRANGGERYNEEVSPCLLSQRPSESDP